MNQDSDAGTINAMVSYAWGTPEQDARVKALVDQLIGDGINVTFDRYDLLDGGDVNAFMEKVAAKGDIRKVIAICTPKYVQRMNNRQGGSGQEGMIMSPGVYEQLRDSSNPEAGEKSRRFIPVIFERNPELPDDGANHLPTMFGSMKYIDMETPEKYDDNYDSLLRFLLDKPELVRPPLGKIPAHLREDAVPPLPGHSQFLTLQRMLQQGKATSATWKDYLERVEETLLDLKPAIQNENEQVGFNFKVAYAETERFIPVRDEFVRAIREGIRHNGLQTEEVLKFFENLTDVVDRLRERHRNGNRFYSDRCFAHVAFLIRELLLYFSAVLMQNESVKELKEMTERTFFYKTRNEELAQSFACLGRIPEARFLEEGYKTQTQTNWTFPLGVWLRERANLQSISPQELVNADRMLWIKSSLQTEPSNIFDPIWRLTIGGLIEEFYVTQPFQRFISRRIMEQWLPYFNASSGDDLIKKLHERFPDESFGRSLGDKWYMISLDGHLKTKEWGTYS
ncbi:toll/interleukin-1 receptor domain-containing protein [Deinococcus antarcticus]|uniref:Toll/interleukin-1 receptor domain-containing protein n=1 Tax=Deinococcus antarcticus TaxID=1298767 RepID=A0ABV8A396_9DEIO